MRVVALAGGVGAGKLLRGLLRTVDPEDVTIVGNTGDDITLHGLHVSPDLDSVTYWLAGVADRDRGWGRAGESFRTNEEVRRLGGEGWFALGDLDLATHLFRTHLLRAGSTLSEATAALTERFGLRARLVPMSDDPVTTRAEAVDAEGRALDLHFQEYWVARGGTDAVKEIRYEGAARARPAPGVLDAIESSDAIVICPSNPVASILPILAVPGIREAVGRRRDRVAAITPIVEGAPLRGMADRLLPAAGFEVSALGVATAYRELLGGFVVDTRDPGEATRVEELGVPVSLIDTVMTNDGDAERVARAALSLVAP
ncbi:MAG TPA: 2-phospho-L-lactate transferase [Acidimicrobiales bacterium]|jgi:LPPG:FO 2-phospho-L-lactate transferase|nr:2-phospho-L-lactate transferase [Acidimicrobiales bacterium]